MSKNNLMNFALNMGVVMLESGAETYRVEDSINRILATSKSTDIESFVTPTGLFVSMSGDDGQHHSYVKRVSKRSIHLSKIEGANDISRRYCQGAITIETANHLLNDIDQLTGYNPKVMIIAISLASGLFALVLGGSYGDAIVTLIAGLVLALFKSWLSDRDISQFFIDLIGGFLTTITGLTILYLFKIGDNKDIILISSIMPLVPGVAITNAIRDTLHGHLVSGSARILDAFIIAASIATGVGVALYTFSLIVGGGL